MFDKALRETRFGADETEVVVALLEPKQHLVPAMYSAFRAHVMCTGCRVQRRKLSAAQKSELRIARRGDSWFTDVIVTKLAQRTHAAAAIGHS